jgi:sRNA-binding carbon storage regulator CsrA
MLSLSRQVGESLVLFVDYDKNPRLLALVKRLGGTADMLKGLCDEITIQYDRHADTVNGIQLPEPEVFLGIDAPRHVAVWRTEKLRRGA